MRLVQKCGTPRRGGAVAANYSWAAHLSVNEAFSVYCVGKIAMCRLWDTVGLTNPYLSVFNTQPGVVLTELNLKVGGARSFEGVQVDDGKTMA